MKKKKSDRKFIYNIGKEAIPRQPFELSYKDCASGIHGFLDRWQKSSKIYQW